MKRMIVSALAIVVVITAAGFSYALERSAVVIGSRVQMHESAAGDSPTVGLLAEGAAVDILGRSARPANVEGFTEYWYRISYRGKTGWVFGQFMYLSTAGKGLARIFTADEMIDYCDRATQNLVNIRNAGAYEALIGVSGGLTADIEQMTDDPILSAYGKALEPYRLFAAWSLAAGYAGAGDVKNARKIKKQLQAYDPGMILPDGTTLGVKINALDEMMRGENGTTQ